MVQIKDHKSTLATDPFRNFKFIVRVHRPANLPGPDFFDMGFMALSGLNLSTEVIPYREGGSNTSTRKLPGQTNFSDITLTRGATLNGHQNWYWTKRIFFVNQGGAAEFGGPMANFRTKMEIFVVHHPSTSSLQPTRMKFNVFNAWPSSLAYSDLDAGGNAVLVEQMVLAHEGWDMHWATSLGANVAAR